MTREFLEDMIEDSFKSMIIELILTVVSATLTVVFFIMGEYAGTATILFGILFGFFAKNSYDDFKRYLSELIEEIEETENSVEDYRIGFIKE